MATGRHGDESKRSDDLPMTLNHEDRLRMLTEGSFRCRPCDCGNSDPRLIELDNRQSEDGTGGGGGGGGAGNGGDVGGTTGSQWFKCRKCNKPYALLNSSDEGSPSSLDSNGDDADGLDIATIECCYCQNTEPDCFSVSRHDNGHLHRITCLACDHGNTFYKPDASAGAGSSSSDGAWGNGYDATGVELSEAGIECIKCPNADAQLFNVTSHPDGRIHKVTCKVCGHGNTFRSQPEQRVANCNNQPPGRLWHKLSALGSAAQVFAAPVWGVAQSLVQKSAQSAFNQASQQVQNNVQNNRPVAEGLRQVGAVQVAALGGNLVLELGDKYLKKLLPMIPDTAARALTRNLSEIVSQWAMRLLAAGQENKKPPANGKPLADGKTPANGKLPGNGKTPANAESPANAKPPGNAKTPANAKPPADGKPPANV